MTRRNKATKPMPPKPKRERELHAKEQLGNLLDLDTRNKLEALKQQLEKEEN